ncbi:MAG: hypothetical protein IPL75_13605 [Acidobacteria bacterium]|nr:hypothetical protein [Acidobacteriota bacterium]
MVEPRDPVVVVLQSHNPVFGTVDGHPAAGIVFTNRVIDLGEQSRIDALLGCADDVVSGWGMDDVETVVGGKIQDGVEEDPVPVAKARVEPGAGGPLQAGAAIDLLAEVRLQIGDHAGAAFDKKARCGDKALSSKLLAVPVDRRVRE